MTQTRAMNPSWPALLGLVLAASTLVLPGCEPDPAGEPDAAVADARPLPDVSVLSPDPTFDGTYVPVGADQTVTTLVQTERPRYAPFALAAVALWSAALLLRFTIPTFQTFP